MNALLTHPLIVALAATLLHSLWIFCVLTALGWWMAGVVKKARQRYLVYLVTLLSFPLTFSLLLISEYRAEAEAWYSAGLMGRNLGLGATWELTSGLTKLGITTRPDWLSYLAAVYLMGLVVSLIVCTYRYTTTLAIRQSGWLAPPELRDMFERLKQEIIPGSRVKWRISRRVTQALAVGILRPFILFPVGLINALSPEEVEVILRHELTHLGRYDPFWNAVQELVVSLFFYHPLVYLLARQLNREREYACDDSVSTDTGKSRYAQALVRAAKFSLNPNPPFTMAANNNSHFAQRIQRLFSTDGSSSIRSGRSFLLAPLAIVPFFLLFSLAPGDAERRAWLDIETGTPLQEYIITGTVTDCDTGEPLIGTSIVVKGTNNGTITDFDGNYSIRVNAQKQELIFSYVGYKTMTVDADATKKQTLDLGLCKDENGTVSNSVFKVRTSYGDSVRISGNGGEPSKAFGENILLIIDGKRQMAGTVDDISPDRIEKIEVIKGEDKIKALGYGVDFEGAIIITMKKKE